MNLRTHCSEYKGNKKLQEKNEVNKTDQWKKNSRRIQNFVAISYKAFNFIKRNTKGDELVLSFRGLNGDQALRKL